MFNNKLKCINFCVHDFPTSQSGLKVAIAGFMLLVEEAVHRRTSGSDDEEMKNPPN
jgi:hypothetical protein